MTESTGTLDGSVEGFFLDPRWHEAEALIRRLQADSPIYRSSLGIVVLTRHADVVALSKSGHAVRESPPGAGPESNMHRLTRNFLSLTNPPDHRRLRLLAQQAFSPKALRALDEQVRGVARGLVKTARRAEQFDLVAEIAHPLPAEIFMEIFALTQAQRDQVVPLIGDILDGIAAEPGRNAMVRAEAAAGRFIEVIESVIADRRLHTGSDLLSGLIAATDAGERLTTDELLGITCQLFVAGMETTSGLLGGGVLALLRHREQWLRLCADPGLLRTTIEECLRVAGPVVALPLRQVLETVELPSGGIEQGERVTMWLSAANRDGSVFDDPWGMDIGRPTNPHVAFSTGMHFCLGSNLARIEAAAALSTLVEQLPDLRLIGGSVEYASNSTLHRPARYLVEIA